jgi:hypothetical protein
VVEEEENEEGKTWRIRIKNGVQEGIKGGEEEIKKTRIFILQYIELKMRNYEI